MIGKCSVWRVRATWATRLLQGQSVHLLRLCVQLGKTLSVQPGETVYWNSNKMTWDLGPARWLPSSCSSRGPGLCLTPTGGSQLSVTSILRHPMPSSGIPGCFTQTDRQTEQQTDRHTCIHTKTHKQNTHPHKIIKTPKILAKCNHRQIFTGFLLFLATHMHADVSKGQRCWIP